MTASPRRFSRFRLALAVRLAEDCIHIALDDFMLVGLLFELAVLGAQRILALGEALVFDFQLCNARQLGA